MRCVSSAATPVPLLGGWTVAAGLQPHSVNAVVSTISALAADGAADRWAMTLVLLAVVVCDVVTALALSPASTIPAAQAADVRVLMRRACVSPLAASVGPGSTLLCSIADPPAPSRPGRLPPPPRR